MPFRLGFGSRQSRRPFPVSGRWPQVNVQGPLLFRTQIPRSTRDIVTKIVSAINLLPNGQREGGDSVVDRNRPNRLNLDASGAAKF